MTSRIEEAQKLVGAAELEPIEHRILLEGFLGNAYDAELAATALLASVQASPGERVEHVLRKFKQNWKSLLKLASSHVAVDDPLLLELVTERDGGRCRLFADSGYSDSDSGSTALAAPRAVHLLSPQLLRLWETHETTSASASNGALLSLLRAFITPDEATRLHALLLSRSIGAKLSNVLLLAPSVADALQDGHIVLLPNSPPRQWKDISTLDLDHQDATTRYLVIPDPAVDIRAADGRPVSIQTDIFKLLLRTDDPQRLPIPPASRIRMHQALMNSLRLFQVEERYASSPPLPPAEAPAFWSRGWQKVFRAAWRLLPAPLRAFVLDRLVRHAPEADISPAVRMLPFGLVAKLCERGDGTNTDNEAMALRLLEKYAPAVPAPLFVDQFRDSTADAYRWLVMTRMPGCLAVDVLPRLSYAQRRQLADDLSAMLQAMHTIPRVAAGGQPQYAICGASGGRIFDLRAAELCCGPFQTEADWNRQICGGYLRELKAAVPSAFSRDHRSVFTHGDLHLANVLVDGGRLSGIVDWECSGFLPEYWDYTKAMRHSGQDKSTAAVYERIWGHKFDDELKAEQFMWPMFPFGGPKESQAVA